MPPPDFAASINTLATYLAHPQIPTVSDLPKSDCLILCASAIPYQATALFRALTQDPSLTRTLVLVGGHGHSTALLHAAIAAHPVYNSLTQFLTPTTPEAEVLRLILRDCFPLPALEAAGVKVLVEDRSTNCGANATCTRDLLASSGVPVPKDCLVVQDPTMSRRTIASFEAAYAHLPLPRRPVFTSYPVFVPRVRPSAASDHGLEYVLSDEDRKTVLRTEELWDFRRLGELLVGEVARLRDDEGGYGPKGRGFIGHMDVPQSVLDAAAVVQAEMQVAR